MGNIGSPVGTRLGINQFWYKHWYSDSCHSLNLRQDKSIEKLITLYLEYGLTFQSNPFIHEYWYRKNAKHVRVVLQNKLNVRFFRRFFYTNDSLGIEHSYLIRHKTPEFFPMRMWLFRYNGWLIISVQWFKPLKVKSSMLKISSQSSFVGAVSRSTPNAVIYKRLKLYLLFLNNKKQDQYSF